MDYLLIAFIVIVVLSPLAWLKTTPGQARLTAFRKKAGELGLKVQLVPAPDADEADKTPEAIRYCLLFNPDVIENQRKRLSTWTLLRDHRRGWNSPWATWRWFRHQASDQLYPQLEQLLEAVPPTVYAVRVDHFGVCLYLRETGDVSQVEQLAGALKIFLRDATQVSPQC